jgi:Holliday junction resolvase RusA-like endonuclease
MRVFRIPGKPIPLARPRFSKTTAKVFDSQKDVKFLWGILLRQQNGNAPLLKGPLVIKAVFAFGTDDSSLWGKPYTDVPDLSNCLKFLEDASEGILYEDDEIVTEVNVVKVWREASYTEFTVSEIIQY